ncbi:hypothetical protein VDT04_003387 [Vibrio cholerae]|uniref:hypothetical protein n=1 Tax=Vibrio TaxID=662 RepID=UPI001A9F0662|nr:MULTISPECIES: hypothetical protein [Vibrio]EJL6264420.1 hypothetical protein [Vibrio cholerae]EJL6442081.1 hypothetical protein [Vibrio cholerae]EJL6481736.1 hypothetical protein [Vibrio cholerae]EKF9639458.1 hypothetical protein [Vibrio cholerae]EMC4027078.1 hypothetical protein [Vibrio cholerae]
MKIPYCFSSEELRLVQAFNKKQAELTDTFVANIHEHVETYTREVFYQQHADDPGEVFEVAVEHIAGVSEDEYDFKAVFCELMPMYQRQSMLVTNWAVFECELKKFYSILAEEKGRSPELPKKKSGSELNHLVKNFQALGLLKNPSAEFNEAFDKLENEVRLIRNDWVHNGGVSKASKNVDLITGVSVSGQQLDISMDYIELATKAMWKLSSELTASARTV